MTRRPVVVLSRDAATPRLRRALVVALNLDSVEPVSIGLLPHISPGALRFLPTVATPRDSNNPGSRLNPMLPRAMPTWQPNMHTCGTIDPSASGHSADAPTYMVLFSAPGRNRTCDTRFRKPMLYPLSYRGGMFAMGFA